MLPRRHALSRRSWRNRICTVFSTITYEETVTSSFALLPQELHLYFFLVHTQCLPYLSNPFPPVHHIEKDSGHAEFIHTSLVILYEATMQHRLDTLHAKHWQSLTFLRGHAIEAVDRTTYDTTSGGSLSFLEVTCSKLFLSFQQHLDRTMF